MLKRQRQRTAGWRAAASKQQPARQRLAGGADAASRTLVNGRVHRLPGLLRGLLRAALHELLLLAAIGSGLWGRGAGGGAGVRGRRRHYRRRWRQAGAASTSKLWRSWGAIATNGTAREGRQPLKTPAATPTCAPRASRGAIQAGLERCSGREFRPAAAGRASPAAGRARAASIAVRSRRPGRAPKIPPGRQRTGQRGIGAGTAQARRSGRLRIAALAVRVAVRMAACGADPTHCGCGSSRSSLCLRHASKFAPGGALQGCRQWSQHDRRSLATKDPWLARIHGSTVASPDAITITHARQGALRPDHSHFFTPIEPTARGTPSHGAPRRDRWLEADLLLVCSSGGMQATAGCTRRHGTCQSCVARLTQSSASGPACRRCRRPRGRRRRWGLPPSWRAGPGRSRYTSPHSPPCAHATSEHERQRGPRRWRGGARPPETVRLQGVSTWGSPLAAAGRPAARCGRAAYASGLLRPRPGPGLGLMASAPGSAATAWGEEGPGALPATITRRSCCWGQSAGAGPPRACFSRHRDRTATREGLPRCLPPRRRPLPPLPAAPPRCRHAGTPTLCSQRSSAPALAASPMGPRRRCGGR